MKVLLDTGVLGLVVHPRSEEGRSCAQWMLEQIEHGVEFIVPEVCDYELRRELIRINSTASIDKLDQLSATLRYETVDTEVWKAAAECWANCRANGIALATDAALDGDVILISLAKRVRQIEEDHEEVVVATTNVKHLSHFVDARLWTVIKNGP